MSATLGGLLKDYRIKKKLSRLEISLNMGWKEPSRLSRIEEENVNNPPRDVVDKLTFAMDIDPIKKGQLLLSGGYLPTDKEIEILREEIDPTIQQWRYPIYITDFSWRVIHWNKSFALTYNVNKKDEENIRKNHPRTLEFIFDPGFFQYKYLNKDELEQWKKFLLHKLILFKSSQIRNTKEIWYINLMKRMMDNDLFRTLWIQAKIPNKGKGLGSYERKTLVNIDNPTKRLEFHIFDVLLIQDPRFATCIHTPENIETFKHFEQPKFNPLIMI